MFSICFGCGLFAGRLILIRSTLDGGDGFIEYSDGRYAGRRNVYGGGELSAGADAS